MPTTGTIIKIRDKEIIVNLGIDDRIQRGDRLEIYNKGSLNKNLTLEQYSKIEPKIIGYAKIKDSDEQISLAELEKPMYVDQVSVNYTVKVVKEKKKPQPKK